jgi:pyrimidine-specific ribonucleoside hydrolase
MTQSTEANGPQCEPQLRTSIVFEGFPTNPELLRADVRLLAQQIIASHGLEEWRICVLTNEMHHHLGIFALIGAKMGLRARELLGASFGAVRVLSFAGSQPPVSCFNDGLQLSSGATLGHGNIAVADGGPARPEARFYNEGERVQLRLNGEYVQRIRSDVAGAVEQHGNLTPAYFAHIRGLALRYWRDWDRAEIFDQVPLSE